MAKYFFILALIAGAASLIAALYVPSSERERSALDEHEVTEQRDRHIAKIIIAMFKTHMALDDIESEMQLPSCDCGEDHIDVSSNKFDGVVRYLESFTAEEELLDIIKLARCVVKCVAGCYADEEDIKA